MKSAPVPRSSQGTVYNRSEPIYVTKNTLRLNLWRPKRELCKIMMDLLQFPGIPSYWNTRKREADKKFIEAQKINFISFPITCNRDAIMVSLFSFFLFFK